MAIASMTASKTMKSAMQKALSEDLEDNLHTKSVEAQMLQFLSKLVAVTPAKSPMAYKIAHYLEENASLVPGLEDVFPQARLSHNKRSTKAEKQAEELKESLKLVKAEITQLSKKRTKATSAEDKAEINDELDEVKAEAELLADQIEGLKSAEYKASYPLAGAKKEAKVKPADWAVLKKTLNDALEKNPGKDSEFYNNLDMLCRELQFKETDSNLLRLLITGEEEPAFKEMIDFLSSRKMSTTYDLLARMTGLERKEASAALDPEAPLTTKGLIWPLAQDDDYEPDEDSALPMVSTDLLNILKEPDLTMEKVARRMIGDPVTTTLDWDRDFKHLGEPGAELIRIMSGTKTNGGAGVNFLLYGLQDSGKTEAVKAAAKKVGITLYMVGEKGYQGTEPSRASRIQSAMMAQALLQDRKDAAILFDEMEDLLPNVGGGIFSPPPSAAPTGISKVFLNRMLEKNQTMTFWTANDPERFHPAVKRRMRFSIEFDIPPASVREQMWLSISARRDFNLSREDAHQLARAYKAPPGMIDTAIRNAVQTGDLKTIRTSLAASADLVFGDRSQIMVRNPLPEIYNPALLRAKVDDSDVTIHELTARIQQSPHKDFSMLLYGGPGTGKSAYAVHLANQLEMEVCLKKASDILGKYVGESEQNIARAFKEASDGKKFLIIDEADTFLRNRSGADKGWEISMVNEMLTQMESHPLPFAMTTNLYDDIDPAAKRRFLFKLKFSPLENDQVKLAFRQFFDKDAPDRLTKANIPLAPADFALVKRQVRFLEPDASADRLAELVLAEAKTRLTVSSGYSDTKAGFMGTLAPRSPA